MSDAYKGVHYSDNYRTKIPTFQGSRSEILKLICNISQSPDAFKQHVSRKMLYTFRKLHIFSELEVEWSNGEK